MSSARIEMALHRARRKRYEEDWNQWFAQFEQSRKDHPLLDGNKGLTNPNSDVRG